MPEEQKDLSTNDVIKNYQNTIEEKIKTIEELFEKFKNLPNYENIESFFAFLHKIKGSAGIYGYQKVSDETKVAVEILRPYKDKEENDPITKDKIDKIGSQMEIVKKEFVKKPDLTEFKKLDML